MFLPKSILRNTLLFFAATIIFLPSSAYCNSEQTGINPYTQVWKTVYPPFEGEGSLVEGADIVGGHAFGAIGFIVGVPLGFVGGIVTQITNNDPDKGFDGVLQASSDSFSIVGKYIVGMPVYLIKKVTYYLPATLLENDITYNKRKKKDGSGKVRH